MTSATFPQQNFLEILFGLFRRRQPEVVNDPPAKIVIPSIGQRVVVHNYHVGEFLESWNGETGIVAQSSPEFTYIRVDGYEDSVSAVGFPHENLLALKGDLANLPSFVTPGKPTITICCAADELRDSERVEEPEF